jgi:hypothetical protein
MFGTPLLNILYKNDISISLVLETVLFSAHDFEFAQNNYNYIGRL